MRSLCLLLLLSACSPAWEKFAVNEAEKIVEETEQELDRELNKEIDRSAPKKRSL